MLLEKGHVLELSEVFTRYCTLSNEASVTVPQSYFTRMHTFKQKLLPYVDTIYDFIVMHGSEKQTLLVPNKYRHIPVSEMVDANLNDDSFDIPRYRPKEDDFLSMVQVALKLRSDILAHPSYTGFSISEDEAISCVPDSLYMFLRRMLGGQVVFESDDSVADIAAEEYSHREINAESSASSDNSTDKQETFCSVQGSQYCTGCDLQCKRRKKNGHQSMLVLVALYTRKRVQNNLCNCFTMLDILSVTMIF